MVVVVMVVRLRGWGPRGMPSVQRGLRFARRGGISGWCGGESVAVGEAVARCSVMAGAWFVDDNEEVAKETMSRGDSPLPKMRHADPGTPRD